MSTRSDFIAKIPTKANIQKEKALQQGSQTYGKRAQSHKQNEFTSHVHVDYLMHRCLFIWKLWKAAKKL
jgi:hypothetical protein